MAKLKAWYHISELADMAQVEARQLRKLLLYDHKHLVHRNGGGYYVYLWDLQQKLPGLWNSILEIESLRFRTLNSVVVIEEPPVNPEENSKAAGNRGDDNT